MLEEIKEYLKITWDDEDIEIQSIIEAGRSNLNDLTGVELDFEEGQAKTLLKEYCRYSYNNGLEYFEENFAKEILRLQLKTAVEEMNKDV